MYCTPAETRKAKKSHQCTNCAEAITPGTVYTRWMSVDAGKAFTNKMHMECLQSLVDDSGAGFWEYMPFSGERPKIEERRDE